MSVQTRRATRLFSSQESTAIDRLENGGGLPAVTAGAPHVPDPHTLLNGLSPEAKGFSVVDPSTAFASIRHIQTVVFGLHLRYTYSRLPQGQGERPSIFSQV